MALFGPTKSMFCPNFFQIYLCFTQDLGNNPKGLLDCAGPGSLPCVNMTSPSGNSVTASHFYAGIACFTYFSFSFLLC